MAQSLHASVCPKLEVITMVSIPQVPEQTLVTIAQMIAPRLKTIVVVRGACGLLSSTDNNDPIMIPVSGTGYGSEATTEDEDVNDGDDKGVTKNDKGVYDEDTTAVRYDSTPAKNEKSVTTKNEKGVTAKNEKGVTAKNDNNTPAKNEKSTPAKNDKSVTAKSDKSVTAKNDKSTPVQRVMQKRVEYDTNGVTVSIDVEKDVANHRVVLRVQKRGKPESYSRNPEGDVRAVGVYGSLQFPLVFSSRDQVADVISQAELVTPRWAFHRRYWRCTACRARRRARSASTTACRCTSRCPRQPSTRATPCSSSSARRTSSPSPRARRTARCPVRSTSLC